MSTQAPPAPEAPPAEPPRRRRPRALTLIGVLLLVVGLGLVGNFAYQAYLDPVVDVAGTQAKVDQLERDWAEGTTPSAKIPGNAVALLRIPEFGKDFVVPVVTGTSEYSLSIGVGWFDHTAAPGQVGNFAVAGHRGRSGPFVPLLDLKPGSRVIVETRTDIFYYDLTNYPKDLTVDKYETWVIDPVPGHPDQEPTKSLITLITCRNFFHSPERSVAFGELVGSKHK